MSGTFERLLRAVPPDLTAVEAFLERQPVPVVEEGRVTFVYRGSADAVRLRHWIYGLPSSPEMTRLPGSDLWHLTVELPERSRVEYKFERVLDGVHEWIRDPANPTVAHDPFGSNSVCHGNGYEVPEWTRRDPEARGGELVDRVVESRALGRRVPFRVYVPARFREGRRYPLLVAHDGRDFLEYASLRTVLDNLIHRLEIPPMLVALIDSADRLEEYAAHPDHATFVAHELVPSLEAEFPLDPRPAARGLLGASFGGVASLHAAWSHPGLFDRLALFSGSFAFTDIGVHRRGPAFDPVVAWVNRFRERPGKPSERVFLACGIYESLIYENRSIVPLLHASGMQVRYVEARDGHNWENWRDRLREGLSWLFPGPLWMVYE